MKGLKVIVDVEEKTAQEEKEEANYRAGLHQLKQ